jgi:hypothetical protein
MFLIPKTKMMKKTFFPILFIIVFTLVIQKILQYCFEIYKFNAFSFIRNIVFLILCWEIKRNRTMSKYSYGLILVLFLLYVYNFYLEKDPENVYLGQDILTLPLTIPGYYFVHLDKLQTNQTIINDYEDVFIPNLYPTKTDKNNWYQYNHFQIGDITYYVIFTSISKYDPHLSFWFHYGNHKTKESYHYNEKFPLKNFVTSKNGEEYTSKCKTDSFNYKYIIDFSKDIFNFELNINNIEIKYKGVIQSKYNQFAGRVFPFSLLGYLIPSIHGQVTADNEERFNDQLIIGNGDAVVNNIQYNNCYLWQDTLMGINTYFMTTWLWIYQRSESFCIYTVWYSDPEYYNSKETVKIIFMYDIKNNKVILNGSSFPSDKNFERFVPVSDCFIDMLGSSVQNKEFYYKYSIKTPNFSAKIQSIEGSSIKVCDDKYMYERVDKNVDYENMEELMKVAEEIRYDEFCNKSTFNIIYNGKEYNETATVVVDSMTWKYGWPTGYKKRNSSFFSYDHPFYTNDPKSNELNGKI